MKVPDKITIQSESSNVQDKLDSLIFELKVIAGTKNPYYIYFPKTNSKGVSELTREDFVGQFNDTNNLFLMDYNGTPETANPIVEVSLYDPTLSIQNKKGALAWPLLKHESTKWKSRKDEYKYRISCRNLEFSAVSFNVNLERTHTITFKVARRGAA